MKIGKYKNPFQDLNEKLDEQLNNNIKDSKIMKHIHTEIEAMKRRLSKKYEIVQALEALQ